MWAEFNIYRKYLKDMRFSLLILFYMDISSFHSLKIVLVSYVWLVVIFILSFNVISSCKEGKRKKSSFSCNLIFLLDMKFPIRLSNFYQATHTRSSMFMTWKISTVYRRKSPWKIWKIWISNGSFVLIMISSPFFTLVNGRISMLRNKRNSKS